MKFATKPIYDITHLTLGMSLYYRGKLKIKIAADIQHIWKKMQTNCIFIAYYYYFYYFNVRSKADK